MVPLATNGIIGKIANGAIGRTPNRAIYVKLDCKSCVKGSTNVTNAIPISFNVLPMVMPVVPLAPPMVPWVSQWYHC